MRSPWTRFSTPFVASALSLAAAAAFAADPIKIGVAGPFTGGSSSMGVSMRDGVRLAAQHPAGLVDLVGRQAHAVAHADTHRR